jgi:hypothetical protein
MASSLLSYSLVRWFHKGNSTIDYCYYCSISGPCIALIRSHLIVADFLLYCIFIYPLDYSGCFPEVLCF